jgi:nitrite reductase/ring-hydroxylating ferredoxin subunit
MTYNGIQLLIGECLTKINPVAHYVQTLTGLCLFHKKTFSLETGLNLQGEEYCINVYPVKVEDGFVYIGV